MLLFVIRAYIIDRFGPEQWIACFPGHCHVLQGNRTVHKIHRIDPIITVIDMDLGIDRKEIFPPEIFCFVVRAVLVFSGKIDTVSGTP